MKFAVALLAALALCLLGGVAHAYDTGCRLSDPNGTCDGSQQGVLVVAMAEVQQAMGRTTNSWSKVRVYRPLSGGWAVCGRAAGQPFIWTWDGSSDHGDALMGPEWDRSACS